MPQLALPWHWMCLCEPVSLQPCSSGMSLQWQVCMPCVVSVYEFHLACIGGVTAALDGVGVSLAMVASCWGAVCMHQPPACIFCPYTGCMVLVLGLL